MDSKAILVAFLTAALGAGCLFMYMKRFEAETSGGTKQPILIATRDLRLGERLDKSALGVRQLPQAYVEQRHIPLTEIDNVVGAPLSMTVHAGEAVLWSDLASMQADRRDLSSLVEPGMRALSVVARSSNMFGGLLRPGDRVDIVYSAGGSALATTGGPTVTLLQNVLVLAIGSDVGAGALERRSTGGRVVTVSLTPEQAQLVVHAQAQGDLDVVLRNPEDIVVLKDLPETSANDIKESERRALFTRRIPGAANPAPAPGQEGAPREIDQVK